MHYANKQVQHLYFTDLFNNIEMHIGSTPVFNIHDTIEMKKFNCAKIQAIAEIKCLTCIFLYLF